MNICSREVQVQGRLCRVAQLDGEGDKFLDDPEPVLIELYRSKLRIDLFTFMQKLPETPPKYPYHGSGTIWLLHLSPRLSTGGHSRSCSRHGTKPGKPKRGNGALESAL